MDMLDLKVFIAVAETESMSKAAHYVALTQPAVSIRIAGLETELDASLFHRTRSGAFLTEAGRRFYFYAQYALSALEAGQESLRTLSAQHTEKKLRIGIVESLTHVMLPSVIHSMKDQSSLMEWKISTGQSLDLALRTASGELDISFINQAFSPLPQLHSIKLFEEPLAFIGPKQPEFPRYRSLFTYLKEVPFILLKRHMPLRELLEHQLFAPLRMHPQKLIEVDTSHVIRQMVEQGTGCSFLPVSSLWPSGRDAAIETISLPEVHLQQSFYCVYSQSASDQILNLLPKLQAGIIAQVDQFRNSRDQ